MQKSRWILCNSSKYIWATTCREDLEAYWRDGYGYEVNYKQACVMFRDVLESLEDEKSGVFSFSHSGAVLKFSSFLGLFNDGEGSPLRHDCFLANANRTYRVVQLNLTPKISAADVTV